MGDWSNKLVRRDKDEKKIDAVKPWDLSPAVGRVPPREDASAFVEDTFTRKMTVEEVARQYPLTEKEVFAFDRETDIKQGALHIIKAVRKSKGVTQRQMGEALGISSQAYYNIERGKSDVYLSYLKKICASLEIKITINGKEI